MPRTSYIEDTTDGGGKQINIVLVLDTDICGFFGLGDFFDLQSMAGAWPQDHIDNTMFNHQ
jgi:hypothetical protein